jgi:hypothetical protein
VHETTPPTDWLTARDVIPWPVDPDPGAGATARAGADAFFARAGAGGGSGVMPVRESGAIVGFRAWQIHKGQLWPVRYSARRAWPVGDARAQCERFDAVDVPAHPCPGPGSVCRCGLHAYREFASLTLDGPIAGDIWGAVIGWGSVELHDRGFRSEWQRIVAIAASPWDEREQGDPELQGVADRYGARLVDPEAIEAAALHVGQPAALELVPVTPLSLLGSPDAWQRTQSHRYDDFRARDVRERIERGSVLARLELASYAVDIAARTALRARKTVEPADLVKLDDALIGLLIAVELWPPSAREWGGEPAVEAFRRFASTWVSRSLAQGGDPNSLEAPATITFGRIAEIADILDGADPGDVAEIPHRVPLKGCHVRPLQSELARAGRANDFIIDALDSVVGRKHAIEKDRAFDVESDWKFAQQLYDTGSRANAVASALISRYSTNANNWRLEQIADDPAIHPHLRAQALTAIAEVGWIHDVRRALAHPLTDWTSTEHLLAAFGMQGRRVAREILHRGVNTDAELAACIGAVADGAAAAAADRLEQRPLSSHGLRARCAQILPPGKLIALLAERIDHGAVWQAGEWFELIADRPDFERPTLIQHVHDLVLHVDNATDRAILGDALTSCSERADHADRDWTTAPDPPARHAATAAAGTERDCPDCGSRNWIPIFNGQPSLGTSALAQVGVIELGAHTATRTSRNHHCRDCDHTWHEPGASWKHAHVTKTEAERATAVIQALSEATTGPGALNLGPACAECGGMMCQIGDSYTCGDCGSHTGMHLRRSSKPGDLVGPSDDP